MDAPHAEAVGRTDDERDYLRAALQLYQLNPGESRRIMLRELGAAMAQRDSKN